MVPGHKGERVLCLYVLHFRAAVERQNHPELAKRPIVVYAGKGRPVVIDSCEWAAKQGVREGMLLSRALSFCPQAMTIQEHEALYRAANAKLLEPLHNLSPEVEVLDLGLAFMGLGGLRRLVGDEQAVAERLLQQIQPSGYKARVVTAKRCFSAEMIARYGERRRFLVPDDEEQNIIDHMPLAVLPAQDATRRDMKRRLRMLGARTLGDIGSLGRVAMQAQFGRVGLEAWRLVRGEGRPLRPSPLSQAISVERQLEPPVGSWQELDATMRRLVDELSMGLQNEGKVCAALHVTWQVEGSAKESRNMNIPLKESGARSEAMLSIVHRCLQKEVKGPLVKLGLQAEGIEPRRGKQMSLFGNNNRAPKLRRLAAALQQRQGKPVLCRVQYLRPDHLEECGYTLRPLGTETVP